MASMISAATVVARRPAPGVAGVPVLDGVAEEHPLGLEATLHGQRHAVATEDVDLDVVPDGLAVDQQPVHVEDGRVDRHRRPRQLRMFTARDTTRATVRSDARDCTIMRIFAHGVSGMVSVGLNAVALVNDVKR